MVKCVTESPFCKFTNLVPFLLHEPHSSSPQQNVQIFITIQQQCQESEKAVFIICHSFYCEIPIHFHFKLIIETGNQGYLQNSFEQFAITVLRKHSIRQLLLFKLRSSGFGRHMKTKAALTCEMFIYCHNITWHQNLEDLNKNHKFCIIYYCWLA